MKSTILLLATLLVLNQTEAKTATTKIAVENEQGDLFVAQEATMDMKNFAPVEDQMIFNPSAAIDVHYVKTIEEVIAQDNQIIDSQITDEGIRYYQDEMTEDQIRENNQIIDSETETEIRPLYIDRSLEDEIAEGNAIIDNEPTSAYQPLDFSIINSKNNKQNQMNL